jgi:hypothetical protein
MLDAGQEELCKRRLLELRGNVNDVLAGPFGAAQNGVRGRVENEFGCRHA